MPVNYSSRKVPTQRAQAIAEFAIVLPILMMILVGILEAGRLLFIYAAVNNASREAVRYASAVGLNDAGTVNKYNDCAGIRDRAKRSAFFVPLDSNHIKIYYDKGLDTSTPPQPISKTLYCTTGSTDSISISSGDRVTVQVLADYKPLIKLIPFPERTIVNGKPIQSTSSRTILGILKLAAPSGGGGCSGCGGGGSATNTPTATATLPAATPIPTDTPTLTLTPGSVDTLTPQPTATITLLPSSTPTFTLTSTPTETLTPTATFTPTSTSTPIGACEITAGPLEMSTTSPFITMTLTNPYVDVTVSSVRLQWNAATGGIDSGPLTWTTASVAGSSWDVVDQSGNYTSPTSVVLPGYNVTSDLIIAFDQTYQNPLPKETIITVNFSTPGCNSVTAIQ